MSRQSDLTHMTESRLFSGFSEAECSEIHASVKPVRMSYRKKETVIGQGDTAASLGIIVRGRILGIRYYYGGDSHILRVFGEREILGLEAVTSSFQKSPMSLIADESSEILSFSYERLISLNLPDEKGSARISCNLCNLLADENIRLIYKTEVLSQKSLRERILIFLRIMKEKKGRDSFYIGMNQDQFAQYLCVNRSATFHGIEPDEKRRDHLLRKGLFYDMW